MNKNILFFLLGSFFSLWLPAQVSDDCIMEVLEIEKSILNKGSNKPFLVSYSIKATDWENTVSTSKVKIYRNGNEFHFFSDQADIYQNEKEMILVLHEQRLIVKNQTPSGAQANLMNNEFIELKEIFLKKAKVSLCTDKEGNGIKTLKLNAMTDTSGLILIRDITYKYQPANKKMLSTIINYKKEYAVKQIDIQYDEFKLLPIKHFDKSPEQLVFETSDKPMEKYRGYEIIDNRE